MVDPCGGRRSGQPPRGLTSAAEAVRPPGRSAGCGGAGGAGAPVPSSRHRPSRNHRRIVRTDGGRAGPARFASRPADHGPTRPRRRTPSGRVRGQVAGTTAPGAVGGYPPPDGAPRPEGPTPAAEAVSPPRSPRGPPWSSSAARRRALREDDGAAGGDERARPAAAEGARRGPPACRPGRRRRGRGRAGGASARAGRRCAPGTVAPTTAPRQDRPDAFTLGAPHPATRRATSSCQSPPAASGRSCRSAAPGLDVRTSANRPRPPAAAASRNGAHGVAAERGVDRERVDRGPQERLGVGPVR